MELDGAAAAAGGEEWQATLQQRSSSKQLLRQVVELTEAATPDSPTHAAGTEACASVTSAFLQVLATVHRVEASRTDHPRNVLQVCAAVVVLVHRLAAAAAVCMVCSSAAGRGLR